MRYGLKLWSINTDYYLQEAKRLYDEKVFDYIELYVVPETLGTLDQWAALRIPFTLHAPHFRHEVNLADPERRQYNAGIFHEVELFRQALRPKYTVIHGGMNGTVEETARQLCAIAPCNALIENKPYYIPREPWLLCRGASVAEIVFLQQEVGVGFCLDIGHAICAANSFAMHIYDYLTAFQKLQPVAYHLSGNYVDSEQDRHLHLHEGNYDYGKIVSIIDHGCDMALETDKNFTKNLDDFEEDVRYFKNIIGTFTKTKEA